MLREILMWISGVIRVLLTPSVWRQDVPYSKEWNRALIQMMKDTPFTDIKDESPSSFESYASANLGKVKLRTHSSKNWKSTFCLRVGGVLIRPSRITILRATDKLHTEAVYSVFLGIKQ
jgi:hypothetical protein